MIIEPQDQAKWMESSSDFLDGLKQLAGVGEMMAPRCDVLLESVKTFGAQHARVVIGM